MVVVLLGWSALSPADLTPWAGATRSVADLDRLALHAAGNFELIAAVRGHLRVQGTASGNRRIYYAAAGDSVIAADRADVLAWAIGAELDEPALALRLLDPAPPHPLAERPLWRGVTVTPPGSYLVIDAAGRPATRCWWQPPEPSLDGREGAWRLRRALEAAVAARIRVGETVSCDLSGGLDSTSVCFLAARCHPTTLIAYTSTALDPADDDLLWAGLAVRQLPAVVHDVLPRGQLPLVYDGIADADERLDEPFPGLLDRAQLLTVYRRMAAHGVRCHLTGFGGDEVMESGPAYLGSLFREHPWLALQRLRGYRALFRWRWAATVRALCRSQTYGQWLRETTDHVSASRPSPDVPRLGWGPPPRLPPWVTPVAAEMVRDTERAAGAALAPLAPTPGQHSVLATIRLGAGLERSAAQLVEQSAEITMAAPMFDDRVLEAALSVRSEDRGSPWEYKPLLTAAMRGIVPEHSLCRDTKAEGSAEEAAGLRANAVVLRGLVDDSRLAARGLVDPGRLRAACRYSTDLARDHESLQQTFAAEVWLRALEARSTTTTCLDTSGQPSVEGRSRC